MVNEDEVLQLVEDRGAFGKATSRFSKFLNDTEPSQLSISEVRMRLDKLQQAFEVFEKKQARLVSLDPGYSDSGEPFEDAYFKVCGIAMDFIDNHELDRAKQLQQSIPPQIVPQNPTQNAPSPPQINHNFFKITPPAFYGSHEQWETFFQIFRSIVHDDPNIPKIQKFFQLKICLKGEAAEILQSLSVTEDNYDIAISLLKERYENRKILIHKHLKNIFDYTPVQKESCQSLRKFIDFISQNYRALENLKEPVKNWDTILLYLLTSKLDVVTRREWEVSNKKDSPTYDEFMQFLKNKCQILETIDTKLYNKNIDSKPKLSNNQPINKNTPNQHFQHKSYTHLATDNSSEKQTNNAFSCSYCKLNTHATYRCFRLLALSIKDRYMELQKLGICVNCLHLGHPVDSCSSRSCKFCAKRHNSILHENTPISQKHSAQASAHTRNTYTTIHENTSHTDSDALSDTDEQIPSNIAQNTQTAYCELHGKHAPCQPLLATAVVELLDRDKKPIRCRAMLDSGSMNNLCTKELYKKLKIQGYSVSMSVNGINQAPITINKAFETQLQSVNHSYQSSAHFLVIDKVTSKLPQVSFDPSILKIPPNLQLADPHFYECQNVDILIGASLFFELLENQQIKLTANQPIIQNSKLGWFLAGPLHATLSERNTQISTSSSSSLCHLSIQSLHDSVQKFWSVENIENKQNRLTTEELECEIHFQQNVKQDDTGRYKVSLPFKDNFQNLGDSLTTAKRCLLSTEKRLSKNSELREQYIDFLKEYEALGHMSEINPSLDKPGQIYNYLPHHPVFKESSETTKVRVVFNGSSATSSGLSLNQVLKTGPKVQSDLFDIVLRMRTHPVVLTADVEKMYRMILVDEADRPFQRILWRDNPSQDIKHYQLNTIVYGLASSSFLATRVLNEIGLRCKSHNLRVSDVIIQDFYMDDLITGCDDVNSAINLKNEISQILQNSGLNLRKWMSNEPEVLTQAHDHSHSFNIKSEKEIKTLGICWNPKDDTLSYKFEIKTEHQKITKRSVLAGVAQLFDPLGLINPIIVRAKLILQEIWKVKLDWDDSLPISISNSWLEFVDQISLINSIKIPRCILNSSMSNSIQLHGFWDSSQAVYGACIYLTFLDSTGQIQSNLICAKSRLAPINSTLTIPKLELSGAFLLAQLMDRLKLALRLSFANITYWTDSTIVLAWLNKEPSNWGVFVSNRVGEIQRLSENTQWRHVPTDQNPADVLSRGSNPQSLRESYLWWHGPSFICQSSESWPETVITDIETIPEVRKERITLTYATCQNIKDSNFLFSLYSSYSKLIRITAYLLRFIQNCRAKRLNKPLNLSVSITDSELDQSELRLCSIAQKERFSEEIKCLRLGNRVPKNSKLLRLNPTLDSNGLCRVDGRLKHSFLDFDQKYPIILPPKHPFTTLLIRHYHLKYLHGGTQFTLSQIRNKFWPINGRNEVRYYLRKCVTCFRVKPTDIRQLMGPLPTSRVTPSSPFSTCGVDFAGPYLIKDGKTRSRVTLKAYVCIFICFSTRAVHVELVTDLTTEAFLNTFKRFISRRGLCSNIYSDNATNFQGSDNELQRLCSVVKDCALNRYASFFSEHKVKWHFIPPRSPHCGGLWEAAVKSFKYHLKRVIGHNNLDYERFYTVLTQVEAILNSRPLIPMSDDPTDLRALTAGHFLIGRSLVACPQDNVIDVNPNRLKLFKQLQQMVQQFWRVWSADYLHSLQQRAKWCSKQENIKIGTMVLLKSENEPPMNWHLGRVVELYPGEDKLVRVVAVRTPQGIFKRAIAKLSPLPTDDDH